ncbi:hypothetical protein L7F22_035357 [Adiantum nelumboides]|nr:hypothetical protein [Adiantum nelumboides]
MWGGPRLHNFLSSNLNGPSLSSKNHGQREATQFIPGIHGYIFDVIAEIYQKEKEKHRITSKIPFILVEDETAIKKRIRWNAKDDLLVGFDGYKTDDHECMTTCMIKVGEGQEGYDKIVDAFQNCVHGGQWDAISSLWNEKLWPRIGMIIGHASDGDSRRRKPMLFDYMDTSGSNAAEIFFSKIESMVGQERSYDLMDMLHTAGILNRLAHFECKEDGPLFARAHKKQEHVWSELNHNESMPKAHLGDYDGVSTDEKIINALKKGLESAQAICERFHMKPKDKDKEKMRWWSKPWKNGFVDAFAKMDKLESDLVEEDLAPTAAEEVDSDNEASLSEIRHVVDSLLDEHMTVSLVVSIDSNKCMFKSTLVRQLNGNPILSKNRLTRVCQRIYYSKKEKDQATSNDNLFGIGSDCAVFFVEEEKNTKSTRQGNPSSIQRKKKTKGTWYLGRVQKMRRKVGGGYVEYKRGFSLTKKQKKPTRVQVQLGWYQKTKGSRCFTYDLTDLQMIDIERVIALANLTYDCKTNKYELEENDWKIFNDFVKDH